MTLLFDHVLPFVCEAFEASYGNCGDVKCASKIEVHEPVVPPFQAMFFRIQLSGYQFNRLASQPSGNLEEKKKSRLPMHSVSFGVK